MFPAEPYFDSQMREKMVESMVNYTVAAYSLAPVRWLPTEILQMIFAIASSDSPTDQTSSALRIMGTCSTWRDIANSTPEMWRRIQIVYLRDPMEETIDNTRFISSWIARSKSCPIDLTMHITLSYVEKQPPVRVLDAVVHLFDESARIESLVLKGDDVLAIFNMACRIKRGFSVDGLPNPNSHPPPPVAFLGLRTLDLSDTFGSRTNEMLVTSIFNPRNAMVENVDRLVLGRGFKWHFGEYQSLMRSMPKITEIRWESRLYGMVGGLSNDQLQHPNRFQSVSFEADGGASVRLSLDFLYMMASGSDRLTRVELVCNMTSQGMLWENRDNTKGHIIARTVIPAPLKQVVELVLVLITGTLSHLHGNTREVRQLLSKFPSVTTFAFKIRQLKAFMRCTVAVGQAAKFARRILEKIDFPQLQTLRLENFPMEVEALREGMDRVCRNLLPTQPNLRLHLLNGLFESAYLDVASVERTHLRPWDNKERNEILEIGKYPLGQATNLMVFLSDKKELFH
jgi:hypothetical protein